MLFCLCLGTSPESSFVAEAQHSANLMDISGIVCSAFISTSCSTPSRPVSVPPVMSLFSFSCKETNGWCKCRKPGERDDGERGSGLQTKSIRLCIYPDFLMEQAQREAEEHERLLVQEEEAWCQQDVFMEGFLAPMKKTGGRCTAPTWTYSQLAL